MVLRQKLPDFYEKLGNFLIEIRQLSNGELARIIISVCNTL